MNFGEFLHSKRWKLVQNYIYSWGAAVVLIGALFKLEHLPNAGIFLGVGLSIEAIIFFISAFEPLMDTPDWKVIYPQLRKGDENAHDKSIYKEADSKYESFFGGGGGGGSIDLGGLPEDQLKSLKDSFEKLSNTVKGLKDITSATEATEGFVKNLNEASKSIGTVVDANQRVSTVMDESVQEIAKSYKSAAEKMQASADNSANGINQSLTDLSSSVAKSAEGFTASSAKLASGVDQSITNFQKSVDETAGTIQQTAKEFSTSSANVAKNMESSSSEFAQQIKTSGNELTTSYKEMTGSMTNGFKGLEKSSSNYTANLDKLNKNLSAINTAYELHLKGTAKVESMVNEYSKGVGEIGKLLNSSVEETKKFNQNTKEINQNIQALNNIYGKMLGALNGKK